MRFPEFPSPHHDMQLFIFFLFSTPIFYACLGGQAHTLKVMLNELNCKAEHTDKLGRTALHCAAFAGFAACIEVLLEETVFSTSIFSA